MFYKTNYASPIGPLTLASDGKSLIGLWMEGQKYNLATLPASASPKDDLSIFIASKNWLDSYFSGKNPDITELHLAPAGSNFRREIWRILCEIPYGAVISYGDIAKEIAKKAGKQKFSSQAVGGAVGHNPIAIIIPCHRVVGSNGSLTGYAGGLDKKIKLLTLEGVDMSKLFVPAKGTAL